MWHWKAPNLALDGGAAVGLLLGDVLTQYAGWRWNFFINVPVGAAMSVVIARVVPPHERGQAGPASTCLTRFSSRSA